MDYRLRTVTITGTVNKSYSTHHDRMRNGKMSQDEFNVWFKEAKEKLSLVRENMLGIDTFEEWLKF